MFLDEHVHIKNCSPLQPRPTVRDAHKHKDIHTKQGEEEKRSGRSEIGVVVEERDIYFFRIEMEGPCDEEIGKQKSSPFRPECKIGSFVYF